MISKTELTKLQKKFGTDQAIANHLGVTRQAVHQNRSKLGIASLIAENPARDKEIKRQYKAGAKGTALALKFGISISQTYRIINRTK